MYVWLGNCDITRKDGKFITLRYKKTAPLLKYLKDKFEDIVLALKSTKKIHVPPVTILEVPHYSIVEYNKHHKHSNPQSFYKDDLLLAKQIEQVNELIRQLNHKENTHSPKFSLDLTRPTKGHKGQRAKAKSHYNYKTVYIDGEHPNALLANFGINA